MDPDESVRVRRCFSQTGDRQRGCVRGDHATAACAFFDPPDDVGLDARLLEYGFYHEFAVGEFAVFRSGVNFRKAGVHLFCGKPSSLDFPREQLLDAGFSGICAIDILIDDRRFHTRPRGDERDACTHHAGAHDAELRNFAAFDGCGSAGALLQRPLVHEKRPNHRRRRRLHEKVREPPRLDLQRGIEGNLSAFVRR